jgi:hypothetical protein
MGAEAEIDDADAEHELTSDVEQEEDPVGPNGAKAQKTETMAVEASALDLVYGGPNNTTQVMEKLPEMPTAQNMRRVFRNRIRKNITVETEATDAYVGRDELIGKMPACVDRKEIMRELSPGKDRANADVMTTNRLFYGYMRAMLAVIHAVNSKLAGVKTADLAELVAALKAKPPDEGTVKEIIADAAQEAQLTQDSICNQFTGGMKMMCGWQRIFIRNDVHDFLSNVQSVNKVSKNVKPSSKRSTPPVDPMLMRDGLLQLWRQRKRPDDILHEALAAALFCAFPMHESDFKKVSLVAKDADIDGERNGVYVSKQSPGIVHARHTKSDYGLVEHEDHTLKEFWKHAMRLWEKTLPSVAAISAGMERLGLSPEESTTNELRKGWENHVRLIEGVDHYRYQLDGYNKRIGHDSTTAMKYYCTAYLRPNSDYGL